MNRRILAVGGLVAVLGLGILSSSLRSQPLNEEKPAFREQAGLLVVDDGETPADAPFRPLPDNVMAPQGLDPIEQQARSLYAQLKQRLSNADAHSPRDLQLKAALDRYFAESQIDQAVRLLEGVIKTTPDTPEAHRAKAAIQMLRSGESQTPSPRSRGDRGGASEATDEDLLRPTQLRKPIPEQSPLEPEGHPSLEPATSILPRRR